MGLIFLEEKDSHVYTFSHKHVWAHASPIIEVFTTRRILLRARVILSNFDKMILCCYLSESWNHEFEFHAVQVS